jgi:hypothetical protein
MRLPRVRFSIRSLMLVISATALMLGLAVGVYRAWLTNEDVDAKMNPLEINEVFKTLSRGDEAMSAIAFQAIEDAWFTSASKKGRPLLSEPTV